MRRNLAYLFHGISLERLAEQPFKFERAKVLLMSQNCEIKSVQLIQRLLYTFAANKAVNVLPRASSDI